MNPETKNITTRIGCKFREELKEIKEESKKNGTEKLKKSDRQITDLIPKHTDWKKIKWDMIEYGSNK